MSAILMMEAEGVAEKTALEDLRVKLDAFAKKNNVIIKAGVAQVSRLPIRFSLGISRNQATIATFYETGIGWTVRVPEFETTEFEAAYRFHQDVALLMRIARNGQIEAAETIAELEDVVG